MQAQLSINLWTALPCRLKLDHEGIGKKLLLDVASFASFDSKCYRT